MNGVGSRDALYYPFINIRDINWLKTTLLCFPHVRRILPRDYHAPDSAEIREFCEVAGSGGRPLLDSVDLWSKDLEDAQERLVNKLEASTDELRARFSRTASERSGQAPVQVPRSFIMHNLKLSARLTVFLEENDLARRINAPTIYTTVYSIDPAWRIRRRPTVLEAPWLEFHPELGDAILSTLARAAAASSGLDIVTDAPEAQWRAMTCSTEEDILNDLLKVRERRQPPSTEDLVHDLAQVVVVTAFDKEKLSRLSAQGIAELQKDGQDLHSFKNSLLSMATNIGAITDNKERKRRLVEEANKVVDEWKSSSALPVVADAAFEIGKLSLPSLGVTLLGAAADPMLLAAASGGGCPSGFGAGFENSKEGGREGRWSVPISQQDTAHDPKGPPREARRSFRSKSRLFCPRYGPRVTLPDGDQGVMATPM